MVTTIFGGGDRLTFPERDTHCVNSLTIDADGAVYVADACQTFMVRITPRSD